MSTLTLKKPATRQTRRATAPHSGKNAPPASHAWPDMNAGNDRPKPSKRAILEAWARLSGIVNTGETDLSTREGLGF